MKYTLLALATFAILAQQAQAKASKSIAGCLKKAGLCRRRLRLLAEIEGVTLQDLLDWNTGLRRDCLNLDVSNYICVKAPKMAPVTDAQGNPVPPAECPPPAKSPQTDTTNPATNSNKPKPQTASANQGNKPQPNAARPLYPNMVPPKTAQQQPSKPVAQGPKAESVWSPVPSLY
ncbi:hypothetical protein BGZ82_001383 [Podila clonocystis]|nr:hypothetical protein BGZ82_001383 [Podila clonocystis]